MCVEERKVKYLVKLCGRDRENERERERERERVGACVEERKIKYLVRNLSRNEHVLQRRLKLDKWERIHYLFSIFYHQSTFNLLFRLNECFNFYFGNLVTSY
jgi:hypothetical protein